MCWCSLRGNYPRRHLLRLCVGMASDKHWSSTVVYVWVVLHVCRWGWGGRWWWGWGWRRSWVIQKQGDNGDDNFEDTHWGKIARAHVLMHTHYHWHTCMILTHSLTCPHTHKGSHLATAIWLSFLVVILAWLSGPGYHCCCTFMQVLSMSRPYSPCNAPYVSPDCV